MSHLNGVHSHEMMTELIIANSVHIFLYIILGYRIQKIKNKNKNADQKCQDTHKS